MGHLPEYVVRGAAHVLVVAALLVVAYVAKETPRARGLWRRLGREMAEVLVRALRRAMDALAPEERAELGALSDSQLRDFWLLPALRRVDRVHLTATRAAENAKAVRLCGTVALVASLALTLRALGGPGVWRSLGGAVLAVGAYLALDGLLVSPLLGDTAVEPLPEARAAALRRGCRAAEAPPLAAGPTVPPPGSR